MIQHPLAGGPGGVRKKQFLKIGRPGETRSSERRLRLWAHPDEFDAQATRLQRSESRRQIDLAYCSRSCSPKSSTMSGRSSVS